MWAMRVFPNESVILCVTVYKFIALALALALAKAKVEAANCCCYCCFCSAIIWYTFNFQLIIISFITFSSSIWFFIRKNFTKFYDFEYLSIMPSTMCKHPFWLAMKFSRIAFHSHVFKISIRKNFSCTKYNENILMIVFFFFIRLIHFYTHGFAQECAANHTNFFPLLQHLFWNFIIWEVKTSQSLEFIPTCF